MIISPKFKKYISLITTWTFICIFLGYFLYNLESFKPLLALPIQGLIVVSLIKVINQFIGGLFLKWSTEVFVGKMNFIEGVYVSILSAIGNYFGPLLGGTSIRALYLKRVHKLTYSKFVSTLLGYYVILFTINSFIAVISLLNINSKNNAGLLYFFGVWLIIMAAMLLIKLPNRKQFNSFEGSKIVKYILTVIYDIENGWRLISSDKYLLSKLSIITIVNFLTAIIASYLMMDMLNIHISIFGLVLYVAITVTSILVSFTPAGIGIKESMLIVSSSTIGITSDQVLQIAIIDRGLSFFVLGVLFATTKILKPAKIVDVLKTSDSIEIR